MDPAEKCKTCTDWTIILPAPSAVVGTPFRKALPTVVCPRCDRWREMVCPR